MNKAKKEIAIEEQRKKKEEKIANQKFANTGKFFILQYYGELSKFSNNLFRYCEQNIKEKK
jgi:hypothetical protein